MTPAERAREIAGRAIGRCEQTTSSGRSVACADCIAEVVADVVAAQAAQTRALREALEKLTDVATEAHLTANAPDWNVTERLGRAIDRARAALTGAPREEP